MARSFNGSELIDLGTHSAIYGITKPFSFSCWAYYTAISNSYNTLIAFNSNNFAFYVRNDGRLAAYTVGADYDDTGSHVLSANTWYHLAVTVSSGGSLVGYVNGSVDATVAGAVGSGTSFDANIGNDPQTAGRKWTGRIADAALWNIGLTASEIGALANGARPYALRPTSIVGYWPLDGLSSPEPDFSGNAFNGTLTGTALAAGPPIMMFTPRQLGVSPIGTSAVAGAVFRRSLSALGTRTGSRQVRGTM